MSAIPIYIALPRHQAPAEGETFRLHEEAPFYRHRTSFGLTRLVEPLGLTPEQFLADPAAQADPEAPVVLKVAQEGAVWATDDPRFDPYRNWLTGVLGGTVERVVPYEELAA